MRDLKVLGRQVILCLAMVLAPVMAAAGEVPEAVRVACSNDYQKYCIKHQPGSDAGRECMADVFEKLTDTCVNAIMNSDLVGEEPVPEASESTVAETAAPPVPARRVATKRSKPKARTAAKARKKRRTRRVRTARTSRKYRVRDRRNDARKVRRRTYASRKSRPRRYASRRGRISRRIARGLRIADRRVSRALARAFRF